MSNFTVKSIGHICSDESGFSVKLDREYVSALAGLEDFSHVQLLYWFDRCDNEKSRSNLTETKPYVRGPEEIGTFATRSPQRPNPIALSCAYVTYIDHANGVIGLAYTDALDGTPLLDIKPYTPSLDRVGNPSVPGWCAEWPDCTEKSGDFDWSAVFNF